MSLYRVVVVGLAAVFTVGMTSLASAGGWGGGWGPGWGGGWGGYGGWGSGWGCGTCAAPSAAIAFAPPPVTVGWGGRCGCGCGGCGLRSVVYAAPPIAPTPIAPAPIYVVNQGPAYDGPGITVPFHTWAPVSGYGPVVGPRYGLGYGYRYRHHFGYGPRWGYGYRPHLAYHRPFGSYPYHRWPAPMFRHSYPWNK